MLGLGDGGRDAYDVTAFSGASIIAATLPHRHLAPSAFLGLAETAEGATGVTGLPQAWAKMLLQVH